MKLRQQQLREEKANKQQINLLCITDYPSFIKEISVESRGNIANIVKSKIMASYAQLLSLDHLEALEIGKVSSVVRFLLHMEKWQMDGSLHCTGIFRNLESRLAPNNEDKKAA